MKTLIRCANVEKEHVHSFLVSELSGQDTCLSGSCMCIEYHPNVPDMLQMDLSEHQIEEFNKQFGDDAEATGQELIDEPVYTPVDTMSGVLGTTVAGYNISNPNITTHSLLHTQTLGKVPSDFISTGHESTVLKLSTVDCSNVDIVVLDTGIDITHPDVAGQVVQFNWALLGHGSDGVVANTGAQIISARDASYGGSPLTEVPTDYYKDRGGHGTACASLAAGKRCGLAKNAKLYALRFLDDGSVFDSDSSYYEGFQTGTIVMQLAAAFMRAKSRDLLGLDSNRPTIFTNSWGTTDYYNRWFQNSRLKNSATSSSGDTAFASLSFNDPWSFDGYGDIEQQDMLKYGHADESYQPYVEEILRLGGHWLLAAGNNNTQLTIDNCNQTSNRYVGGLSAGGALASGLHYRSSKPNFTRYDSTGGKYYLQVTLGNYPFLSKKESITANAGKGSWTYTFAQSGGHQAYFSTTNSYTSSYRISTYPQPHGPEDETNPGKEKYIPYVWNYPSGPYATVQSTVTSRGYTSGLQSTTRGNLDSLGDEIHPAIVVGDVTPVGTFGLNLSSVYWTGGNSYLTENILSAFNNDTTNKLLTSNSVRYNTLSDVAYVKSGYSNFGKLVDVYAPGNQTWAAVSNFTQPSDTAYTRTITATPHLELYKFFNGTSAACPVAAGALATYLANNITATPLEAKNWMLNSAISGNILETSYQTVCCLWSADMSSSQSLSWSWDISDTARSNNKGYQSIDAQGAGVQSHVFTREEMNTTNCAKVSSTYFGTIGDTGYPYPNVLDSNWLSIHQETDEAVSRKKAMLQAHRFHQSNNLIVQAFPSRATITPAYSGTSFTFLSSDLEFSAEVNELTGRPSHPQVS
jgi:hypothetical protein